MSAGVATISVSPVISAHAVLGAAQTAAVAAAGAVAVAAAGAAVTAGVGAGMAWAVSRSLKYGADASARSADACARAVAETRRWEGVVGAVAERNARTSLLRAACRQAGISGSGLPDLVALAAGPSATAPVWTAVDEAALRRVETSLASHRTRALMDRLHAAAAPAPAPRIVLRPSEVPRRIRLREEAAVPVPVESRPEGSPPPDGPGTPVTARLEGLLADERLALATDAERVSVEAAAAAVLRSAARAADLGAQARTGPDAGSAAIDVQGRFQSLTAVIQDVGDAVKARRAAAEEAATLLQPLLPDRPGDAAAEAVRGELLEVMSGRARLTADLRIRALEAIERVLAEATHSYLDQALAGELRSAGLDPDTVEISPDADGGLEVRLGRGENHTLRLALRPDPAQADSARLVWSTVRTSEPEQQPADGTLAADVRSCEESIEVMDRLTQRLLERGAESEGRVEVGPGEALPVESPEQRRATDEERRLRLERQRQDALRTRAQPRRS